MIHNIKSDSSFKRKGFTLVELIVVIVILSILATIAFLSFSSQSASARDSTRLSDMSNIAKWLSVNYALSGKYPLPDSKVDITATWITLIYQWYAWSNVLNMIKLSSWWKDPLDTTTYYTYSTNLSQTKFELLWFLEDWSNSALSYIPQLKFVIPGSIGDPDSSIAKLDSRFHGNDSPLVWLANADPSSYSWRFVITKWDQLWILLSSVTKLPVQETWTWVDILKTSTPYIAQYTSTASEIWTWQVLSKIVSVARTFKTCKEIFDIYWSSTVSWYYKINPTNNKEIDAYCDMSFDWWWWTRVIYMPFELNVNNPIINYSSWAYYSQYEEFSNYSKLFSEVELKTELWKYSKCQLSTIAPTWKSSLYLCNSNTINVNGSVYTQDLTNICFMDSSTCKVANAPTNLWVKTWNPTYSSWTYWLVLGEFKPLITQEISNYNISNRWCSAPTSPDVITWMTWWDHFGCNTNQNMKYWWKNTVSFISGSWVTDTELHLMLR
ncbi:MAG: hypothetical protein ACD_3C00106G0015 [uncultured bacterium (gcode 4)]|uniref:Uncharacterized protein n=1 Tax=uncultured bacterium (gcode 4) TaxID=1234023 RepID=K2FA93_9BACT|nr:MAG: hypothetical protein ACD_3C00106G0015 [uncultured bacterium (gcode 4)]